MLWNLLLHAGWRHRTHQARRGTRSLGRLGTFVDGLTGCHVGIDEFFRLQLFNKSTGEVKDQTVLQGDEGFPIFAANTLVHQFTFIVRIVLLRAMLSRTPVGDTHIASHLEASCGHATVAHRLLPDQARLSTHRTRHWTGEFQGPKHLARTIVFSES